MMRFYQTSESGDNGEVSPLKNKFLAFMEKLEKQERTTHRSKRRAILRAIQQSTRDAYAKDAFRFINAHANERCLQ
jgi:hypothetical protein